VSVWLERLAIVVASLALSIGLIALLSGFFAGRDQAGISAGAAQLGQHFPDQGVAHLAPGELHPAYNSDPPTSGPHIPAPVLRDATQLTDDQLLQALEMGDVVIDYGTPAPPAGLRALATSASGPFTSALAATGQAVVLAQRPDTAGLIALAWTRMLHVASVRDPRLRAFTEQWLGHGAHN
jgi:hypothetical protein